MAVSQGPLLLLRVSHVKYQVNNHRAAANTKHILEGLPISQCEVKNYDCSMDMHI